MHQTFRLTLGMVFILTLSTGEALAQYYGGYGGWGGETPEGNFARGAGFYELGAGVYNRDTAIANSIEQDTILRWNEYMFQSQQEANRRAALRRARQNRRTIDSGSAISKRVRENPDEHDLRNGDALNAILDEITNPKVHGVALRTIKNPISGQVIREIPFESASEAVTLSLHQLTGEGKWPVALHGETFAAERKAYQEAIAKAVEEDEDGNISPETLQSLNLAASRLRAKLVATKPASGAEYAEAANYIKALVAMSRMLEKPRLEKILAELDKVKTTTLGSLLAFMHAYNLRFGPATTEAQHTVYQNLYPIMAEGRDKIMKGARVEDGNKSVVQGAQRHPVDFFQGLHLEQLEGRSTGDQTKP
jgi:hypothetical protein